MPILLAVLVQMCKCANTDAEGAFFSFLFFPFLFIPGGGVGVDAERLAARCCVCSQRGSLTSTLFFFFFFFYFLGGGVGVDAERLAAAYARREAA
jgi:hypothetical protein